MGKNGYTATATEFDHFNTPPRHEVQLRIEGLRPLNPGDDDGLFVLEGVTSTPIDQEALAAAIGADLKDRDESILFDRVCELIYRERMIRVLASRIVA